MNEYPLGAKVTFADASAVVASGETVVAHGVVSGEAGDGYVPVFAERSGGREATTIYVAIANILTVEPREKSE